MKNKLNKSSNYETMTNTILDKVMCEARAELFFQGSLDRLRIIDLL